jgi:hypothetical protein
MGTKGTKAEGLSLLSPTRALVYTPARMGTAVRTMREIDPRFFRYREAYLAMSERARYRPAAPSDGMGHIQLEAGELGDRARLDREADRYAVGFVREDDATEYPIGCPDFAFNKAFCWVIEAARLLCSPAPVEARKLLRMAVEEINSEIGEALSRGGPIADEWRERLKAIDGRVK